MIRAVVACILVLTATPAAADPSAAYVDEIGVIGGPDATQARAYVVALVQRAGMQAKFADPADTPCGDDDACLADRARRHSAVVGLRLTIADVAGRIIVSMLASNGQRTRREIAENADLDRPTDQLAVVLRELAPVPSSTRHRLAPWMLVAASVGLTVGGVAATWHAYTLRDEFFAAHVDTNGDVYGVSPPEARAEERRAQRWSLAGGIAFGAAAITGFTGGILFVKELP